jgi:hypothetical protein
VVTNTGLGTTGALTASLTGTNASEFGITQNNCTGQLHGSGGTCSVFVRLSPSSAGGKTASLNVTGTPGGTQSSTLTGTATPTGQRAAALKKCKKKKDKQKRKKCKKKANRLPV